MKRMLINGITVLAIVGSALAFRSAKADGTLFCREDGTSGTCPAEPNYITQNPNQLLFCGTAAGGDCSTQTNVQFIGE